MIAKTEIFPIEEAFPHGEWNKTIAKFPDQATVFHTREWMKTLEDSLGYRPMCILAMCEDEGGFQAALPFMVYEKFGTKNWLSMPFDTYGGVIGNQKYAPHLMSHFFRAPGFGVRRCIDFNREPLVDGNGEVSTEIMDISLSTNVLWERMHKDNRTAIRYAWKKFIVVETSSEYLGDIFKGVPPALYESIIETMVPANLGMQVVAKWGGEIVAASLFFFYGDMAIYWANSVSENGRKTNANYSLMWNVIRYAKERGCTTMNFGASPEGADSLVRFKKSWGTRTWPYVLEQRAPAIMKPFLAIRGLL